MTKPWYFEQVLQNCLMKDGSDSGVLTMRVIISTKIPSTLALSLFCLGVLSLFCVVPTDTVQKEFNFNHAAIHDTVAPIGSIDLVFSEPLSDSSQVELLFSPPFYAYALAYNAIRDTVTVQLAEPLKGNTKYIIRLENTVFSVNNSVFQPQNDSVMVETYAMEQEPNNTVEVADTLFLRCYGTIAVVNDTDWYVVDKMVGKLYLHSVGSQTTFSVKGVKGIDSLREYHMNDTVTIPETTGLPLLIAVYSYFKSVGGYYLIGCGSTGR